MFSFCRLPLVRLGFKDNISICCQSTKQKLSTYYDDLNLKPGCTKKEIRNSYIKLSKLTHPDIFGTSSNDRFIRINEAYNVLIDDKKKTVYDKSLTHTSVDTNRYRNIVYYPQHQYRGSWREDAENHWLASNIAIAVVCFTILIIGSGIRYIGVIKSSSVRSTLMDESDEYMTLLEKQKLMKTDKTMEELVDIFEKNILKEYDIKK